MSDFRNFFSLKNGQFFLRKQSFTSPMCFGGSGGAGGPNKKNKVQGKSGQRTDVGPWELSNVPHVGPYNSSYQNVGPRNDT